MKPFKVHFRIGGTNQFNDDQVRAPCITTGPVDASTSHADLDSAEDAARYISQIGGSARITLRDGTTGEESELKTYAPYEVAGEDSIRDTGE